MENKNIETIVKEAFSIGRATTNYYLLNYGIKHKTVDLIISYSGSSSLDDSNFHFILDEPHEVCPQLIFQNDGDDHLCNAKENCRRHDQIIAWERHVKIYYKDITSFDTGNKNTLQLIFENGEIVNIKTKQDILDFKWNEVSVNDFMIFIE